MTTRTFIFRGLSFHVTRINDQFVAVWWYDEDRLEGWRLCNECIGISLELEETTLNVDLACSFGADTPTDAQFTAVWDELMDLLTRTSNE